jgi:hypothetical protein
MGTKRRKTSASIERSGGREKPFYRFREVGFYACLDDGKMTQNAACWFSAAKFNAFGVRGKELEKPPDRRPGVGDSQNQLSTLART